MRKVRLWLMGMAAIGGVMPCSCRPKGIDVQAAKAQEKLDIDVTTFGEVEGRLYSLRNANGLKGFDKVVWDDHRNKGKMYRHPTTGA